MAKRGDNRWSGHPWLARAVRLVAALSPAVVSWLVIRSVADRLPAPAGGLERAAWWAMLAAAGTLTLILVDIAARRLLPLSALLRLSLVFPDRAPSRYSVALRTGTVRQLEQRLEDARANGLSDEPTEAATQLVELVAALNQHDRITRGHAERVRAYTRLIGEELELPAADLEKLQWAGLLHDVGKVVVPAEILNKPGRLTDEEWDVIKTHPAEGAKLTEPLRPWLGHWVDAVGQHHERWDGAGYPNGIASTDIAIAARIVSVADTFDVITAARSYKEPQPASEARAELARCAGSQFDPAVVRAFLGVSLGRLRLVMGPLAWITHLPALARIPLAPAVGAGVSALVTTVGVLVAGVGDAPAHDAPTAAIAAPPADPDPPRLERAKPPTPAPSTTTTSVPVDDAPPEPAPAPQGPAPSLSEESPAAPGVESPSPVLVPVPALDLVNDAAATAEDTVLVLQPASNDAVDAGVADLTAGSADHGWVVVAGEEVTYTPEPDFHGVDSFDYEVTDGIGAAATAAVSVTVNATNDAPVAADDAASVDEDGTVDIDLLADDADVDGDSLALFGATDGSNGTVVMGVGGSVTYVPAANWFGTDTFTYTVIDGEGGADSATVTITVAPLNDAPNASDDAFAGSEGVDVIGDLLINDSDEDGDPLTVSDSSTPSAGSVVVAADGTFTYTPPAGFDGTAMFTYDVTDGSATVTASVTLTIDSGLTPFGLYLRAGAPAANVWPMSTTAPAGTGAEPDHDDDDDPGVTIKNSNGESNENSVDKTQIWTVAPATPLVLNGPVVLDLWSTSKDFNIDRNGHLSTYLYDCAVGGSGCVELLAYDEHLDVWNGGVADWVNHRFTLGSLDHTVSVGRELRLKVLNQHGDIWIAMSAARPSMLDLTLANATPVAVDDNGGTALGGIPVTVDVVANDVDTDLDPASLMVVGHDGLGSAVANPDGTITYTPSLLDLGVVTITYEVADSAGQTDQAVLTFLVL